MKIQSVLSVFLISSLLIAGCVSFSKDIPSKKINSDSGQDSKIIVRELASPIADVSTFNMIVQSVIADNPFGCVGYVSDGKQHDPVEKVKEVYTAVLLYEDNNGNFVRAGDETFNSSASYISGVGEILSNNHFTPAQGSIVTHDSKFDSYGTTLKCNDENDKIHYIVFTRDDVTLISYIDDSIRTNFETWANTVPSLTPVEKKKKQENGRYLGVIPSIDTIFSSRWI